MTRKGPGLEDVARGRERLEDRGRDADRSDGKTTADDFGEGREVGCHTELPLGTLESADAKASHHLVEHEERAVVVTQFAQAFVIALHRGHARDVSEQG